jgi:Protein of unknown function (DUF4239)
MVNAMVDSNLESIFSTQWRVFFIVLGLLLVSAEWGFHVGLRLHRTKDEARKWQLGGIQGAVLALLGLLLGFTFAMSTSRYEARGDLVLQEANAIRTIYLRAALLPESRQTNAENLLRRYVDARIAFHDAGPEPAAEVAAEQEAARLQAALWADAIVAARENPTPVAALYIAAVNDLMLRDAARLAAMHSHVPGAVWLLVLAVSLCGCGISGYSAGASGARSGFANILLPLLIAVVITLITDLDRPRGGLIGISQQPILDLKQAFHPGGP